MDKLEKNDDRVNISNDLAKSIFIEANKLLESYQFHNNENIKKIKEELVKAIDYYFQMAQTIDDTSTKIDTKKDLIEYDYSKRKNIIPQYINDWLTIIEQMNNDNTYKLAWGRAIIECIVFNDYKQEKNRIIILFDSIALRMLKYYWNQLFFFNLKQSPYKDKDPIICKDTEKLIGIYKEETKSSIPVWFDEAENFFLKHKKDIFDKIIKHISKTLHENVSWRFKNVLNGVLNIYELDTINSFVILEKDNMEMLKEYSIIISKLLNYKLAQLLEKYNFAPKISSKVNGISEAKLKRNDLSKYKKELLKEFEGKEVIDFYTGKCLEYSDISIDHVIPWSFMYSDDIWNLVITSKSNNSSKSNSIPSKEIIEKLKARNDNIEHLLSGNFKLSMEEAIKNNYVDKFYFERRM